MTAVNLKNLLIKANKNKYAIAGLVVLGWEDAIAYTEAADETKIPIILQAGPSCREHTNISTAHHTPTQIIAKKKWSYAHCFKV